MWRPYPELKLNWGPRGRVRVHSGLYHQYSVCGMRERAKREEKKNLSSRHLKVTVPRTSFWLGRFPLTFESVLAIWCCPPLLHFDLSYYTQLNIQYLVAHTHTHTHITLCVVTTLSLSSLFSQNTSPLTSLLCMEFQYESCGI